MKIAPRQASNILQYVRQPASESAAVTGRDVAVPSVLPQLSS